MKKIFVKALSVCLAMITLLVASMLPVSAATTKAYFKSVEDSLGTKVTGYLTVEYTPASGSTPASFHQVRGSSYLYVGDTKPTTHNVYLHSLAGAVYTNDYSTIYYRRYSNLIEGMTENLTYAARTSYNIDQNKSPVTFHHWAMLAYVDDLIIEECVNELYFKNSRHRSQVLTQ